MLRKADGDEKSLGSEDAFTTDDGRHVPRDGAHSDVGTVLARVTVKDKKRRGVEGRGSLLVIGSRGRAGGAGAQPDAGVAPATLSPGETRAAGGAAARRLGPGRQGRGPGVGDALGRGPLRHAAAWS